jgi:hypothetical protein
MQAAVKQVSVSWSRPRVGWFQPFFRYLYAATPVTRSPITNVWI